ncbi:MAG: hypothetical protein ABIN01_05290 [Ferruginibacter sp.]
MADFCARYFILLHEFLRHELHEFLGHQLHELYNAINDPEWYAVPEGDATMILIASLPGPSNIFHPWSIELERYAKTNSKN